MTRPVPGPRSRSWRNSSVSCAACHKSGLTELPVCGPSTTCDRRLARPSMVHSVCVGGVCLRLAQGALRRRRRRPCRRGPRVDGRNRSPTAATKGLRRARAMGRNSGRTWQYPWRPAGPAGRLNMPCARNGAKMEDAPFTEAVTANLDCRARPHRGGGARRRADSRRGDAGRRQQDQTGERGARGARRRAARLRREPGAGGARQISRRCAANSPTSSCT